MSLSDVIFFGAISMLLLHEMDAVDKREWRLFVALLALVAAGPSTAVRWIQGAVDSFLVIHAGLHERLIRRGDAAFANLFSRWLVWGAATLGAIHAVTLIA